VVSLNAEVTSGTPLLKEPREDSSLKADSHIACRAHGVPLIHTCHAAPLQCSDGAVSFVKVRVVTGNIRTASPTTVKDRLFCSVLLPLFTVVGMDRCEEDWYAAYNNFVELRVVARRSPTRAGSSQAVSRRPCCAVALRRTAWSEHGMGMAWQV
jgi:hypothetical protein